jgi:hypothetical protein
VPAWESVVATELSTRHHVTTRKRLQRLGISRRVIDGLCSRGRLEHSRFVDVLARREVWRRAVDSDYELRLARAMRAGGFRALLTYPWVWQSRRSSALALEPGGVGGGDGAAIRGRRRRQLCLVRGGRTRRRPRPAILGPQSRQKCPDRGPRVCRARRDGRRPPTSRADHSYWRDARTHGYIRRAGFSPLTRQHPVEFAPGSVVHPDLGISEEGFFVEVDHLSWHGARLEGAYDRRRDLKARARTDLHVERVTDIAIDRYLEETIGDLLAVCNRIRTGP